MYLPFLRGRQNELAALAELNQAVYNQEKVVPIIEPVTTIKRPQYERLRNLDIPLIIIVNPTVGTFQGKNVHNTIKITLVDDIYNDYEKLTLGFVIHPQTTIDEVQNFIDQFSSQSHAFIHYSQISDPAALRDLIINDNNARYSIYNDDNTSANYRSFFSGLNLKKILLSDGFNRMERNQDYPDFSIFSNLYNTYSESFDGFGDFAIVGDYYSQSGGSPYCVTLHLTDIDERGDVFIRHFKSNVTPPLTNTNPGGKFSEALEEMSSYLLAKPGLSSTGITEYKVLHESKHYPGLGIPKRLSIIHHIEFMHSLLEE